MGSGDRYNGTEADRWAHTDTVAGVKVLRDTMGNSSNLPTYSKTSEAYFKRNKAGEVSQMRVYGAKNSRGVRNPVADIDMGQHTHTNNDGTFFPFGVAHVHEYSQQTDARTGKRKWARTGEARFLTEGEMRLWGEKLRKANPRVRLRT